MRSREGKWRAPPELQIGDEKRPDYKLDTALDQVISDSADVEGKDCGAAAVMMALPV